IDLTVSDTVAIATADIEMTAADGQGPGAVGIRGAVVDLRAARIKRPVGVHRTKGHDTVVKVSHINIIAIEHHTGHTCHGIARRRRRAGTQSPTGTERTFIYRARVEVRDIQMRLHSRIGNIYRTGAGMP